MDRHHDFRLPDIWGEDADIWNPDRFSRAEMVKQTTNIGVFANLSVALF